MIFGPDFSIELLLYSNVSVVVNEEWQTDGLKPVTVSSERILRVKAGRGVSINYVSTW